MSVKNKTINLYTEWKPLIDGLSDLEAGKLLKDIFQYQSGEEVFNDNPVWLFIKSKIDEYNLNGTAISKARSEAGKKGMEKRWGVTNDNKCYQMITTDNKNNNKIKENKIKENKIKNINIYISQFDEFWEEYTPIKCNGKFIDKGSKKTAFEKFVKILDKGVNYEDIIRGTRAYINHCRENNQLTCGATVFLNQERWKNDYSEAINGNAGREHEQPSSILETYSKIASKYQ